MLVLIECISGNCKIKLIAVDHTPPTIALFQWHSKLDSTNLFCTKPNSTNLASENHSECKVIYPKYIDYIFLQL